MFESVSVFAFLSWAFSLINFGLIALLFFHRPHLAVKPSFIIILFLNVTNQWSSAFHSARIEAMLSRPWDYFIVVHIFPLLALVATTSFFDEAARRTYAAVRRPWPEPGYGNSSLLLVVGASALIIAWYLSHVPFHRTGLYTLWYAPSLATMARERSLKLLDNQTLKYAFALVSSTLAPLAMVLTSLHLRDYLKQRQIFRIATCLVLMVFLIFCVSIDGSRGPGLTLLLTACFVFFLRAKDRATSLRALAFIPLFLLLPTLFTLFREGAELSGLNLWAYYMNTLDRSFGRGIEDGVWQIDYVQKLGFFGLSGIGNIVKFLGIDTVDTFNIVGRWYAPGVASVSANTSFVISYYGCFGLAAFPLCFLCLLSLDLILLVYPSLRGNYLLPCVACIQMACTKLSFTYFTTIFLTNGFLAIPIVCYLLQRRAKTRPLRRRSYPSQSPEYAH